MSGRDWVEDFTFENCDYYNRCVICGEIFVGHKWRVCCKVCHDKLPDESGAEVVRIADPAKEG